MIDIIFAKIIFVVTFVFLVIPIIIFKFIEFISGREDYGWYILMIYFLTLSMIGHLTWKGD